MPGIRVSNTVLIFIRDLRKARVGLSPAFKKRKAEIYPEEHFCGNCGVFMDEFVRYCGGWGENNSKRKDLIDDSEY
jgi:hypothetical protein